MTERRIVPDDQRQTHCGFHRGHQFAQGELQTKIAGERQYGTRRTRDFRAECSGQCKSKRAVTRRVEPMTRLVGPERIVPKISDLSHVAEHDSVARQRGSDRIEREQLRPRVRIVTARDLAAQPRSTAGLRFPPGARRQAVAGSRASSSVRHPRRERRPHSDPRASPDRCRCESTGRRAPAWSRCKRRSPPIRYRRPAPRRRPRSMLERPGRGARCRDSRGDGRRAALCRPPS